MKVSELMSEARVLASNSTARGAVAAGQGFVTGSSADRNEKVTVKCFRCQGSHLIRDCQEHKMKVITYFRCGEKGQCASGYQTGK